MRILNQDGVIQIENFVFKSMLDDGYVLEMHASNTQAAYEQFNAATFNPSIMNQLTNEAIPTERDIFQVLRTGVTGATARMVQQQNLFHVTDKYDDDVNDAAGTTWRAKCKTAYQKAVFYFSLMAEMKYMAKGSGFIWTQKQTQICFQYNSGFSFDTYCEYRCVKRGSSLDVPQPPNQIFPTRPMITSSIGVLGQILAA